MAREFKTNEDIYPLTIVQMRYGGKYVALNCNANAGFVSDIQSNEEVHYEIDKYLKEKVSPGLYGISDTL